MLRSRAAHQGGATAALDQISTSFKMGDWKLLHILGLNMEPLVFGELVVELADQMKDVMHKHGAGDIINKNLLTEI